MSTYFLDLSVSGLSSHSRFFHLYAYGGVTFTYEGLQILT